ncbi:MAG TPA: glycosyltransferase family A protein [Anaeromyxobacteraceae bacterium]|nr:glycosyltransferase family A protein [Anaeromyxobacteraceae bacterium]
MPEERFISVVIPARNAAATLDLCLRAAFAADYGRYEVVVVDDASEDASAGIIRSHPCKSVRLDRRGGVSRARNAGAEASSGELLFFTDADCLLERDALSIANAAHGGRRDLVLGGTYTPLPFDTDFFSAFQSVFIHHFETRAAEPDYVATHAMVVDAELFRLSGGFRQDRFMGLAPSVEDVELSHRLRRAGCRLAVEPRLRVRHVFRFSLRRSLGNAIRKARHWTRYSLANRDVLADSGTASLALKANVLAAALAACLLSASAALGSGWPLLAALPLLALDLALSRGLIAAWFRHRGPLFGAKATLYYLTLYAAAVGIGAAAGTAEFLWSAPALRGQRSCTVRSGTRGLSS